ncbi:hypothetical protein B0H14DRAFT_3021799, partial [Mycena olivaceomarginata]
IYRRWVTILLCLLIVCPFHSEPCIVPTPSAPPHSQLHFISHVVWSLPPPSAADRSSRDTAGTSAIASWARLFLCCL